MCTICRQVNPFAGDWLHPAQAASEGEAPDGRLDDARNERGDAPAGPSTSLALAPGESLIATLGPSDVDWIRLDVPAGETFVIATAPGPRPAASDTYLLLMDGEGTQIDSDDDDGQGFFSRITHISEGGPYYAAVMSYETFHGYRANDEGSYRLSLSRPGEGTGGGNDLPLFTPRQIAEQLTTGYWEQTDRSPRRFDVSVENGAEPRIHVDYADLSRAGRWFAEAALDAWSAVTGLVFTTDPPPGGGRAQIRFDDEATGAFANASVNDDGITERTFVNVSGAWIAGEHYRHDSYSLQTFIHEVGHALGLGHAGNYNDGSAGDLSHGSDAQFANDSWQATVMSYFSQSESAAVEGSRAYLFTPMSADIVALRMLYGTHGTLRAGDTVYGRGGNSGDWYDRLAGQWQSMAFTLVDDGGTDLIDFSETGADQRVSLRAGTHSSVGGETGNMTIARGTVIEHFTSGAGDDRIEGNRAANVLLGGKGADSLVGRRGADSLAGGRDSDSLVGGGGADNAGGGFGRDVLRGGAGPDSLFGGAGADRIYGGAAADVVRGGPGPDSIAGQQQHDTLLGLAGADTISGGSGSDRLSGGTGADRMAGAAGADTIAGGPGADTLTGDSGHDRMDSGAGRDLLRGGSGRDTLLAGEGGDSLRGGEGADLLRAGPGADSLRGGPGADTLAGGPGNDLLDGGPGADLFLFAPGGGRDRIVDWEPGRDRLDLSAFGFAGPRALPEPTAAGGRLELRFEDGATLVLEGLAPDDLSLSGDVLF